MIFKNRTIFVIKMSISYVYFNNSNDKLLKINKNVAEIWSNKFVKILYKTNNNTTIIPV